MNIPDKIIILFFIVLTSCTTTDSCRENTDVKMQIGFYTKTQNTTTKLFTKSTLSIDSIWVNGLGVDSFYYKKILSTKSISIPLKNKEQQTDYIIRFNKTTDTISVFYQNNDSYYLSLECGCVVAHTIDEVVTTGHFIDSLVIINREINNINAENIQIYHF